ncbi:MAG: cation transporter [Deltaproteobacteria bacterium]
MAASAKRALVGATIANLAVATTKLLVGTIAGSTVMIAEGIHSFVDTGNSGLILFGSWRSRRPADETHPFGYGMELYFWSGGRDGGVRRGRRTLDLRRSPDDRASARHHASMAELRRARCFVQRCWSLISKVSPIDCAMRYERYILRSGWSPSR